MAEQFKAGDVVQLKSGGPKMTVSKLREWQGQTEADCDWFEGTKMQSGSFPLASLKFPDAPPRGQGSLPPVKTGTWS
jgi:uncharacterized protein YodC (DUF2158 family)